MKELNATQQAIIMSFFDPFVDVIVDRVSERICFFYEFTIKPRWAIKIQETTWLVARANN